MLGWTRVYLKTKAMHRTLAAPDLDPFILQPKHWPGPHTDKPCFHLEMRSEKPPELVVCPGIRYMGHNNFKTQVMGRPNPSKASRRLDAYRLLDISRYGPCLVVQSQFLQLHGEISANHILSIWCLGVWEAFLGIQQYQSSGVPSLML